VETGGSVLNLSTAEFGTLLKTQFGPELRRMIEEAEQQRQDEVGAMICLGPDNTLHLGRECWGRARSVILTDCKGARSVGSFHVHLYGSDIFSPTDLNQGIAHELYSCLGYMKNGVPTLKVIGTHMYPRLPQTSQATIRRGIAEADSDIQDAIISAPRNHEKALLLTSRAHKTLQNIEKLLNVYVVEL